MPYGNINVDTVTTTTPGGILGGGNASLMKNRIINGAMVIDQRNTGSSWSATNGGYSLDRWQTNSYTGGGTTGKFTVQQNAGSITPPEGFTNYLGITASASTSTSASDIYTITQIIEGYNVADLGWGTANAKTITISFWVRSSLTGTFGCLLRNDDGNRNYAFTYTISSANTWEKKSVTVAGCTDGTWLKTNGGGLYVFFGIQVGTNFTISASNTWNTSTSIYGVTGCVNVLNTSGNTLYLTGVQLEVGSSATGFEYVNYQTSLANCQRYYAKMSSTTTYAGYGSGYCSSTSQANSYVKHSVPMRTAPTISQNNLLLITGGAVSAASSIASSYAGIDASTVAVNASSAVLVTGQGVVYCQNSGGSGYLDFSAEL